MKNIAMSELNRVSGGIGYCGCSRAPATNYFLDEDITNNARDCKWLCCSSLKQSQPTIAGWEYTSSDDMPMGKDRGMCLSDNAWSYREIGYAAMGSLKTLGSAVTGLFIGGK